MQQELTLVLSPSRKDACNQTKNISVCEKCDKEKVRCSLFSSQKIEIPNFGTNDFEKKSNGTETLQIIRVKDRIKSTF